MCSRLKEVGAGTGTKSTVITDGLVRVWPLWKTVNKVNVHLLRDPAIPHLGIHPREDMYSHKDLCMNVHCSIICKVPKLEIIQMSRSW